jgi:hypothetical protein
MWNDRPKVYITDVDGIQHEVCPDDRIPTDDPNLPSYLSSDYRAVAGKLAIVDDVYRGDVKKYLPQWTKEPDSAYKSRLQRTKFNNVYKSIVSGFPGLLSRLENEDSLYDQLLDCKDNIDMQGNSLQSFQWEVDLAVITHGCAGVLVDMPRLERDEDGETIGDDPQRAYLVMVNRRDIISWEESYSDGYCELERVTIRRCIERPVGIYGSEKITTYKSFFDDGSYRTEVICVNNNGGEKERYYAVMLEYGQSTLEEVPLTIYSATDIYPLSSEPPLYNVAELNLSHYELYSEYRDIIHKINFPTAVRIGVINSGCEVPPPMILGSNSGIDVPKDGDFKFASPDGSVLATDRAELDALLSAMNEQSLRFLSGASGAAKTATEALLSSTQVQATMAGIARLKTSFLQEINRKWAAYYGDVIEQCDIGVNQDLLKLPLDAQTLSALSGMASSNQLSVITLLEMMKDGLRLPDGVKPSLEIQRIAAQEKLQQKRARDELTYQSQLTAQVTQQTTPTEAPNNVRNPNSQDQA